MLFFFIENNPIKTKLKIEKDKKKNLLVMQKKKQEEEQVQFYKAKIYTKLTRNEKGKVTKNPRCII